MSEKINLFFESMAERLTNENDLSDITYALCKTDEDFRKFFLEYCFESPVDTDNLIGQNSSFVTELKPSKNHGIASSTK